MILQVGFFSNDFTKDLQRILIKDFTMDFTNFYGFVKKMVQKNQFTDGMGWDGWDGWNVKSVLKIYVYCVGIQKMYIPTYILY